MDFPWLTTIGVLPLLGALVIWLLPEALAERGKQVALGVSLLTLAVVIAMVTQFHLHSAGYQFAETQHWIPQLGVSYALGIDGIALTMVGLSVILMPICVLASWNEVEGRRALHFMALMLVLETFMIGVFAARDIFLFYVFFEGMLIPVYFLIGAFGGQRRRYAAVKFLIYSLVGGLLMLVAVIGLYAVGPGGADGFLVDKLTGLHFSSDGMERWLFVGFFFAFAVKAPLWPVHTWLPDAAAEAPAGVAVLLVGVLDKVGTFGMITLCLPLFPGASRWAAPVILALAVVSVLYGALVAIAQTDLKRLIAYTSVSHFGFIVLGIFALTSVGQNGATLYMVNHGFSTAALFLIGGMLIARRGSQRIGDFGGLQRATPLLAGTFLVGGLSSLALPGTSSFVSEFLVLVGTYYRYPLPAIVAGVGIVLAAFYILLTYKRIFTGPVLDFSAGWKDLTLREGWVVAPVLGVILVLGVYPRPVLDLLQPAVERTMQQTHVTDPLPSVEVAGVGSRLSGGSK